MMQNMKFLLSSLHFFHLKILPTLSLKIQLLVLYLQMVKVGESSLRNALDVQ